MDLTPRSVRRIRVFGRLTIVALLTLSVACGFAAGGTGKTTSASALAFTNNALPSGFVGASYSQHVSVVGGASPYSFAVSSGTLPAGVRLGTEGLISGTPTSAEQ